MPTVWRMNASTYCYTWFPTTLTEDLPQVYKQLTTLLRFRNELH
jgi:hypothetical protein